MQYLPNSPITDRNVEKVIDTFEMILSDLPAETVEAATRQYLSTGIFFPTPGHIREIAMDLQMLAIGVPTPTEAWGMVMTGLKAVESVFCTDGASLRDTYISNQTPENLSQYSRHVDSCHICLLGGFQEVYAHPAVTETVRLLGGRDIILTDNATSDRARFVDAYREVVARERMKTAMLPEVKQYVDTTKTKALSMRDAVKQLVKGFAK